jgi:hypothetical protein
VGRSKAFASLEKCARGDSSRSVGDLGAFRMGAEDEATRSILIEGRTDLPEEQVGSRANSDDQSTHGQCFRELRLVRGTGTLEAAEGASLSREQRRDSCV